MITRAVWRDGKWRNRDTGEPLPDKSDGLIVPHVQSDYEAYYSHGSGKMIEGRKARRDDLARTGCRPVEPDEGPKYCHTKKWAERLKMDHQPLPKPEPRITTIGPDV